MLEKLGLPAKPSLRGNTWVVDSSHCQSCSSQFTFINRKHHCRRCGGLFCNSCTLQRMVLRLQGDSPVRICDPCKKLEEAARFELCYGKNRPAKEEFTLKHDKELRNSDLQTLAMLFTKSHEELVKEGEQWMKDTSNSCTIVGALIVTIVFAAAITVPGGNNDDNGRPICTPRMAFKIFAISDALALFASTSSVSMFLSILTSRYGEQDFLYALPKRLIIGLATLFLSIIFMMIAFGATLQIMFGEGRSWILIPVAAFSCAPVLLFVFLQFPLLLDMIKSTYGPGIFGKQSNRILF